MATIRALADAAASHLDVPVEAQRCLERIKEQVRDMTDLCARLLDVPEGPRRVSVNEVARRLADDACLAYGCAVEVATAEATIEGDEVRIRQMLWNLVENACRAAGPTGKVRLDVARDGDDVRIEVSDDGPGFGQGPKGRASMGFLTTAAVATSHGGRVEISSSDLGGAQVAVVLPVTPPARSTHRHRAAATNGAGPAS